MRLATPDCYIRGVDEVSRQPRLMRRNGRWGHRVRVPNDLRHFIGKSEIWRSLGTGPYAEACRQARLEDVRVDTFFADCRAKIRDRKAAQVAQDTPLSDDAIYRYVQQYFHFLETQQRVVPFGDGPREAAVDRAIDEAAAVHSTPAEAGTFDATARKFVNERQIPINDRSLAFGKLVSGIKAAMDEHHSREIARLTLQPVASGHPLFAEIAADRPPRRTLTLSAAVAAFIAAPERAERAAKTHAAWRFRYAVWKDLLGQNRPVKEITRDDVKRARVVLLSIPPNAAKRWPNVPLARVADIARRDGLPTIHPKSVQLYLEALNTLMRWLVAEGELSTNPAAGLGVAGGLRRTDKERRPLTTSDLQRLFACGPFTPAAVGRGWTYWLPLIGLFAGMRLGEITGLLAGDVVERNGTWIFDLKPNSLRPLKTPQSVRVVPVHPTLVSLGFLEHAAGVPQDGALFPDLPGISSGTSNAAQKAIGRWIRSVFPGDQRIVFHSLRHTWTDALRNARVPSDIAERLGGWKPVRASSIHGYGDGYSPAVLAEEITKVSFPGLDLGHLLASCDASGASGSGYPLNQGGHPAGRLPRRRRRPQPDASPPSSETS